MIKKINLNNNSIILILLSITFIASWISLGLNPSHFSKYLLFNQIRLLAPSILFLIFIFFYFFFFKEKKMNFTNIVSNLFVILLLIFFFFSVTNNYYENFINLYWFSSMLIPLLCLNFISKNFNYLKIFFIISIVFLVLIFFHSMYEIFKAIYKNNNLLHFYGFLSYIDNPTNHPRATGQSRIILILSILLMNYLFFYEYKLKKSLKYFLVILIVFLISIMMLFQSRTGFVLLLVSFFYILFLYKDKFYKVTFIIFFIFIISSIITYSYNLNLPVKNSNFNNKADINEKVLKNFLRKDPKQTFDSTRYVIWDNSIYYIKKNILRGHGFQSDRILLKDSMHNAYLYAFLCGGIFGFIIIIMIVVAGIVQIAKRLRTQINKNDDIYFNISSNILIILILRGLLETSFAIFGIDYILFILSIYIIYSKREISRSEAKILL